MQSKSEDKTLFWDGNVLLNIMNCIILDNWLIISLPGDGSK